MADRDAPAVPVGERVLWSTRLLLLGGVAGSAVLAAAVIWMGTVDLVRFVADVAHYTAGDERSEQRSSLIASVVKIVDTYLLAAILVVVAFGLYELFVSRLDARRTDGDAPRLLVSRSLDDLKNSIAKLVVLILVIEFFQRALGVVVDDAGDLVVLGGGIALVSLALAIPTVADWTKRGPTTGSDSE